MNTFTVGDKVTFRESTHGAPELGTVTEILPPSASHPNGGLYLVRLSGQDYDTEVWCDEITATL